MIFNSLDFIIFFIAFFTIYIFIPKRIRYVFVLLASYYFYMHNGVDWIYLIIGLTIFIYFMGLLIHSFEKYKKLVLVSTLFVLLSVLIYYKYREFIFLSLNIFIRFPYSQL